MLNHSTVRLLQLQKQRRLQRHQQIAAGPSQVSPTSDVQETSNKADAVAALPLHEKPPGSSKALQTTAEATLEPVGPATSSAFQQPQNQPSASLAPFEVAASSQLPSSVKPFSGTPRFGASDVQGPTASASSPLTQAGASPDQSPRGVSGESIARLVCGATGPVSGTLASPSCKTFGNTGRPQDASGGAEDDAATESIAAREAASCASSALALGHPVVSDSGRGNVCSHNIMLAFSLRKKPSSE